jgi:hypothetical protein
VPAPNISNPAWAGAELQAATSVKFSDTGRRCSPGEDRAATAGQTGTGPLRMGAVLISERAMY